MPAMPLLLAVVEDLSQFALRALGNVVRSWGSAAPETLTIPLHAPVPRLALPVAPAPHVEPEVVAEIAHEPAPSFIEEVLPRTLEKNTIMYTASYATPLKSMPEASGDATIAVLPYGSMVMVLQVSGPWAYVASGPHEGWAYGEDLEDRAAHVYPAFHIGEPNRDDDPSTERLRALINDEFGAGEVGLPLQAEEYVLYRLWKRGAKIAWPPVRPRSPGTWASILASVPGIRVSPEPTPGAVMEFTLPHEGGETFGHLAYVEAVFPDGTLQLSEANWPEEGIYNERALTSAEWQELAPAFIIVS